MIRLRAVVSIVLLAALLAVTAASASEESERQYSHGLVEFHVGRYAEALALFERAVAADATDVYARYYRGVTYGRLGQYPAAISDLRAVTAAKPDFDRANLELGVALVQTGEFAEAVGWLERAQAVPETDARASFFLGLAHLRLGRLGTARELFARAADRAPTLSVPARYYQGVVAYRAGDMTAAETHFAAVVDASPESEMGREAAAFLEKLQQAAPVRRYRLYADLGFQYDSNITLAPSGDTLKGTSARDEDGRAVFTLGGTYVPWQTERSQLSLGYEFFQSLHTDRSDFDLQDHRPGAQLALTLGAVNVGLTSQYDYYSLHGSKFLQQATALPWVRVREGAVGRTEVFYRMRWRDFLKDDFDELRSAFNHAPGVRQVIYLGKPERYVSLGYRFDREDPTNEVGNRFAYDGHEVNTTLGWVLPAGVSTEAGFAYRRERYARQSRAFSTDGRTRRDDERRFSVVIAKRIAARLSLQLAYLGTLNDSSDKQFEYERHIVSLTLRGRY